MECGVFVVGARFLSDNQSLSQQRRKTAVLPALSSCGAQNLRSLTLQILTAASSFCSLYLPPEAVANEPLHRGAI